MKKNKLCLGTAQLGLHYGIHNQIGRQPTKAESFRLLEKAMEQGIEIFDTAGAYGNAEKILGEFGIGQYPVKIISKLHFRDLPDQNKATQLEESLIESLQNLRVAFLDGYLLHNAKDFYDETVLAALQHVKKIGLVRKIGVSVYEETDAVQAVKSGLIDYIQVPYNVFDRRLDQCGFFELAKQQGVTVFARSAFLQGLLLMEVEQVPANLREIGVELSLFRELSALAGFSCLEAAFLFSYTHESIQYTVFGVETEGQLDANIAILEKVDEFLEYRHTFQAHFQKINKKILMPNLW